MTASLNFIEAHTCGCALDVAHHRLAILVLPPSLLSLSFFFPVPPSLLLFFFFFFLVSLSHHRLKRQRRRRRSGRRRRIIDVRRHGLTNKSPQGWHRWTTIIRLVDYYRREKKLATYTGRARSSLFRPSFLRLPPPHASLSLQASFFPFPFFSSSFPPFPSLLFSFAHSTEHGIINSVGDH